MSKCTILNDHSISDCPNPTKNFLKEINVEIEIVKIMTKIFLSKHYGASHVLINKLTQAHYLIVSLILGQSKKT